MDYSPLGSSVHVDSPGNNTKVGCHALLHGIFLTQGSNPSLPHCRQLLYCLSHQRSPVPSFINHRSIPFFLRGGGNKGSGQREEYKLSSQYCGQRIFPMFLNNAQFLFLFFFKYLFILAVLGLSCDSQCLHCGM